jgi:hypothetical protein
LDNIDQAKDEQVKRAAEQDAAGLKASFSDLVGCWEDDPAFDEIIASQRMIDSAKW